MPHRPTQLDHFLSRARLRWIVWRVFEHAALGLAAATIVGLTLTPILFVRRQPALPVVAALMGLGSALGAIAAFRRVPTRLDVAMQLDRQLDLSDLVASAELLLHRRESSTGATTDTAADTWHDAVIASADDRIRSIAPRELILHRLGLRAWSGIGLGGAMAITLALLQGNPQSSMARSNADFATEASAAMNPRLDQRSAADSRGEKEATDRPRSLADGNSPDASRIGDEPTSAKDPAGASRTTNSDSDSRGASSGSSRTNGSATTPRRPAEEFNPSTDTSSSLDNRPAPGSGRSAPGTPANGVPVGGIVTRPPPASPAPWATATWDADRAAAMRRIDSTDFPDAYRDLVRTYFER